MAVTAVKEGRQVHGEVVKCGLDCNMVFDEMFVRTVVSWNAVITACVENMWFDDGMCYFLKMRDFGFELDETTMVVMLSLCAELGNLSLGRWIHSLVIVRGMVLNFQLGTALVNMYAKSGDVDYVWLVFDRVQEKNVWTWSAMILGLAQHGPAKEALDIFLKMM
ncbi:pentatricopeptide repeat-containing protein [Quercus suber]|uniref:Pentatricopeptide repeat-containing protein n=1 Tax=Quercus suber TaxID=58331 RepID=A0AAW0KHM1_QUESU